MPRVANAPGRVWGTWRRGAQGFQGACGAGAGAGEGRRGGLAFGGLLCRRGALVLGQGCALLSLSCCLPGRGATVMTRATARFSRRTINIRAEAVNKACARKGACVSIPADCQLGCTLLGRLELCQHSATRSFF